MKPNRDYQEYIMVFSIFLGIGVGSYLELGMAGAMLGVVFYFVTCAYFGTKNSKEDFKNENSK